MERKERVDGTRSSALAARVIALVGHDGREYAVIDGLKYGNRISVASPRRNERRPRLSRVCASPEEIAQTRPKSGCHGSESSHAVSRADR